MKPLRHLLLLICLLIFISSFILNITAAQEEPDIPLSTSVDTIPRREIGRLGRGSVISVAWLPDGLAVLSSQGLWLYDAAFTDQGFLPEMDARLIAWQGKRLLSIDPQNTLQLFSLSNSLNLEWSLPLEGPPQQLAWHPDGSRLAMGFEDGQIDILNIEGDVLSSTLSEPFTALSWAGENLAAGYPDGQIIFWNPDLGEIVRQFPGHRRTVTALAWSGNQLASGDIDGEIRIWDVDCSGEACLTPTLTGHSERIQSLAWHPDGVRLASATGHQFVGGEVRVWDTRSGQTLNAFSANAAMKQVMWNPDGSYLLASGEDNLVRIWDTDGRPITTLQGFMDGVEAIAWNPNGLEIAAANDDGQVRLWNPETAQPLATFQGHGNGINAVDWRPDGEFIASAGLDNTIRIWVRGSGKTRTILRGHSERVWSVDWHPSGTILASASRDATVRVWNPFTGEHLHTYTGPDGEIISVKWSPDGTRLAASSDDGSVWIWDAATGETIHTLHGHNRYVFTLDWHPAKNQLLSDSWFDGTMRLWDAETGNRLDSFGSMRVMAVAWNPSGRLLASADADGIIRIWDMDTGQVVKVLRGHAGIIYGLAWRPDGRVLASGGADETIRLWGD
jgi:YD repeat-containing protein